MPFDIAFESVNVINAKMINLWFIVDLLLLLSMNINLYLNH